MFKPIPGVPEKKKTLEETAMAARSFAVSCVSGAALLAGIAAAHAGAFGLREQSAVGQGSSFAGAAAGAAGLGSMFWNPATITNFKGGQVELVGSGIFPVAKMTTQTGSSPLYVNPAFTQSAGDIGQDAFLPAGYASYQINSQWWVGVSLNTPFGLTTKANTNWPGRTYGATTRVLSTNLTPTIGYKINDMFSVAAGLQIMHFKTKYTSALATTGVPVASWPVVGLEGDSWGVGFTLGATIKPMEGTEIGIGYRSAVQENLSGNLQGLGNSPIKSTVMLPESINVGLRQRVTNDFTALVGFEWTNWSRLKQPAVINQTTGTNAAIPFIPLDYNDGWYASVGGEYRINPSIVARAGIGYEESPIDTQNRSLRLPDANRWWFSVGAGYQYSDSLFFDIGYTYILPMNGDVAMNSSNPGYNVRYAPLANNLYTDTSANINIISASVRWIWDNPKQTVPAGLPKVTK